MKSRSSLLVDRSLGAMISAIEVYNKPTFEYREETFSILLINAWELLLKGRILQIDRNRLSSILEYSKKKKRDGTLTEKVYRKKNRSGNHLSINLFKAYDRLTQDYKDRIDPLVRKNLEILVEVRDNSIHFMNKDFELRKKIFEAGTANLKNYLNLVRKWFGLDLSKYNLFLMPLAFINDLQTAEVINVNNEEKRLINYIKKLESSIDDETTKDYNLTLNVEIRLKRGNKDEGTKVIISDSPDAVPVKMEEEDIRNQYPWDYNLLTNRLKSRYSDFKQTQEYHKIRRKLEQNKKYCNLRLLDPGNPKSAKKNFYNPNILREFDKYYTRRKADISQLRISSDSK